MTLGKSETYSSAELWDARVVTEWGSLIVSPEQRMREGPFSK